MGCSCIYRDSYYSKAREKKQVMQFVDKDILDKPIFGKKLIKKKRQKHPYCLKIINKHRNVLPQTEVVTYYIYIYIYIYYVTTSLTCSSLSETYLPFLMSASFHQVILQSSNIMTKLMALTLQTQPFRLPVYEDWLICSLVPVQLLLAVVVCTGRIDWKSLYTFLKLLADFFSLLLAL